MYPLKFKVDEDDVIALGWTINDLKNPITCYCKKETYRDGHFKLRQFIGILDKNKKEIYYGDRVKIKDTLDDEEYIGVVGFEDASFMVDDGLTKHYRWMDYEVEVLTKT